MRYKIIFEYDGSNFFGWQKQKHTSETIQEYLEKSLKLLTGENSDIFVCGRTDSGVHALNQVAHFDLREDKSEKIIVRGLNYFLCDFFIKKNIYINKVMNTKLINYLNINSIIIKQCEKVEDNFDSRLSSKKRYYRYIILNQNESSVFDNNRSWLVRNKLDLDSMKKAADKLLGKHNFTSFRSSECQALSPIKTLDECSISMDVNNKIYFDLKAKSFLHHMVRNIVGTLKDVGSGKTKINDIDNIITAEDRQKCGVMAPACGLYFVKVDY